MSASVQRPEVTLEQQVQQRADDDPGQGEADADSGDVLVDHPEQDRGADPGDQRREGLDGRQGEQQATLVLGGGCPGGPRTRPAAAAR